MKSVTHSALRSHSQLTRIGASPLTIGRLQQLAIVINLGISQSISPTTGESGSTEKQQPNESTSPDPSPRPYQTKPKKQKRGSLVIAPIPISSPAFGSGLLLVAGYVFKPNQEDKTSPSSLGLAGALTSNGTGALALP